MHGNSLVCPRRLRQRCTRKRELGCTSDRIGYTCAVRFTIPPAGLPRLDGIWIRVEGDELPSPAFFRLGVGDDGQLIATGLLIATEKELTTRATRLPLAGIVSKFAAEVVARPTTDKRLQAELAGPDFQNDPRWREWAADSRTAADFVAHPRAEAAKAVPRVRPGRRGYPDDFYRTIAKQYAKAKRARPRAPIRALMSELHAAEPTVHRWLRTARDKGFIKEAKRGD
jgi:hypothetical protein